jgi:hypothetical protein
MHVPEIFEVKQLLTWAQEEGYIKEWELPYENILTRLSAAIFFLTPTEDAKLEEVWKKLGKYENLSYRINEEKKLSDLKYRITFSAEEKEKMTRGL